MQLFSFTCFFNLHRSIRLCNQKAAFLRCSDKAFSYNLLEMIKTISLKCKENSSLEKYLRKNSFLVRLWGFSLCASLLIFCVQLGRKGRKRKFKTKSKLVNGMQDSRYILKCFLVVQYFLNFFLIHRNTHIYKLH